MQYLGITDRILCEALLGFAYLDFKIFISNNQVRSTVQLLWPFLEGVSSYMI